jgi:hemolysin activation/secretion protein
MPRLPTPSPLCSALLAALATLSAPAAMAAEPAPPNAGTLLQQVTPPAAPTQAPRGTGLSIERAAGDTLPDSAPFEVKTLKISGNTRFDTATLQALVADAQGTRLTLAQLGAVVARITAFYRQAGYPLARALIPAQTIREGVVAIEVIEARFGQVRLDNRSAVASELLSDMLTPLRSGEVISQAPLDRTLLLLNELPGLTLGAVLQPGQAVGTADLSVTAEAGPVLAGEVAADNNGNAYTGRAQASAGLRWFNPLHRGDTLSANLTSSGEGLNYGRLAYETQLNAQGTRAAAAVSSLRYKLGGSAADLQAHGTASVGSVWMAHPLLRSAALKLRGQLQFDRLNLRDHVDATAIRSDRHIDLLNLNLGGDAADLLPRSSTAWNLSLTAGRLNFDNTLAAAADDFTAQARGSFTRLNLMLAYRQALAAGTSLALRFSGQAAQGNLDPSQKMSLGGPYSVRAYDSGAVSGDSAYSASAELQQVLNRPDAGSGQWDAAAFVDVAHATINQKPWQAGLNTATLSGAGVSLNWTGPDRWLARASVAVPVGSKPALAGVSRTSRGWIELLRSF